MKIPLLNFIMWWKAWLLNVLPKMYYYEVERSHLFQPIKIKDKIKKLTINIILIYENDNYYEMN